MDGLPGRWQARLLPPKVRTLSEWMENDYVSGAMEHSEVRKLQRGRSAQGDAGGKQTRGSSLKDGNETKELRGRLAIAGQRL